MTFLVYSTECLFEMVRVVWSSLWKNMKFCLLCALKQICGQFHDTYVRVPRILHINGLYQLQNCVWGWKSGNGKEGKQERVWKVLSRKSRKRNSYDRTLNFFWNYLFLPVDTIITFWSEWSFCDLCFLFKSGIRACVETVLTAVHMQLNWHSEAFGLLTWSFAFV